MTVRITRATRTAGWSAAPLVLLAGLAPVVLAPVVLAPMVLASAPTPAAAAAPPAEPRQAERRNLLQERRQRFHGVASAGGMVAGQEPFASGAGIEVLQQGGNAVDAAVATAFALAVTHPQAGNLGGGGFLLLWLPGPSPAAGRGCVRAGPAEAGRNHPELRIGHGTAVGVDFRETAPAAARPDLFLRPDGSVDRQRATRSLLSTAVPGSVAGLTLVQRCYGRLPLPQVMAPAIRLADEGFPVSRELSASLEVAAPRLQADPVARRLFYRPPDRPAVAAPRAAAAGLWPAPRPGERLRQPELAATLRRIAAGGEKGFHEGPVAAALVALMEEKGGLITRRDLRAYRARLVKPLQGRFRGHPVLTMPPPSSGLTLLQLLGILEPFDLVGMGHNSAATLHRMVEAMNLAYHERNTLLGDPEQVPIPVERLLSERHLNGLRRRIDLRRHRPADAIAPAPTAPPAESPQTTHLSVADRQGGMVALTTTLNFSYGNGIAVPTAGFLLNNEMDDFSARPGSPNAFGLVQGANNAIAPGRRPLSSMSPTLVFRPGGDPWLATGSPGGSRIITTVLQVLLNRMVHGLNLASAVAAPRLHSQLLPDRVDLEQGISPDTRRLLEGMGHSIRESFAMGAANSVEVLPRSGGAAAADTGAGSSGGTIGVADPRRAEGPARGE